MRNTHISKIIVLATLCGALSTACSGGGGMSQIVATSPNTTPAAPLVPEPDSSDTGIAGMVAAPAAATFATAPPQLAAAGGPSFDGSSGSFPSPNVTFPLLTTALQKTSTGLSAAPSDPAATLTINTTSSNFSRVQLTVPSVGISQSVFFGANLGTPDPGDDYIYGLSYVATAGWGLTAPAPTNPPSTGVYVFGYQTPQAAMPTSGTAVFTGPGLVQGTVYKTVGTEIQSTLVGGNASITANFGSGAVNGSFTQMMVTNTEHWNDVSVTANIAAGSNTFSGTTAAASAPGAPMSLSGSATGKINGAFYGPAAQNLGAVWSLSDGTGSAIGTVVAGH